MKKIVIFGVVAIVVGVLLIHFRTYNTVSQNFVQQQFKVEKGDDIIVIGRELAQQDLIANRLYFYYYAWKNKLRGSINAGDYVLDSHSRIADIVYKMTSGDTIKQKKPDIKITFPEGWGIQKMTQRLTENNLPGEEFARLAQNPSQELRAEYPFLQPDTSLEGYLFPDTYFFMPNVSAENIIKKLLDNFDTKVDKNRRDLIEQQGNNLHEVIIFASIVEGEVSQPEDRRIVTGIFKNRLDIGMALESDATIDYIKGTPEIKHTQTDIEIDSLYNTYKYPGLPPGPINNPSLESIDAVIMPIDTEYMYFLNNVETGETIFAKTFDEHIINKRENGL